MTVEEFKFDKERAMDFMSKSSMVDLETGQVTIYAVICLNDDGKSSHGGQGVLGPADAIAFAEESNRAAVGDERHTCKYVPVAIGLPMRDFKELSSKVLPRG